MVLMTASLMCVCVYTYEDGLKRSEADQETLMDCDQIF